jgi:hypothetical protein
VQLILGAILALVAAFMINKHAKKVKNKNHKVTRTGDSIPFRISPTFTVYK